MPEHVLLDETIRTDDGVTLRRIRAGRDLPDHEVTAGDLSGWVQSLNNVENDGWVSADAMVFGRATVGDRAHLTMSAQASGQTYVGGQAIMTGQSRATGLAVVSGNAQMRDTAEISGSARLSGYAQMCGNAKVDGDTLVSGRVHLSDGAELRRMQDLLVVGPLGSANTDLVLYRTTSGHTVRVGCWQGQIDELVDEVDRRARYWIRTKATKQAWRTEYAMIAELCRVRATTWEVDR